MNPEEARWLLLSLHAALLEGTSLQWAVAHASVVDPVPEAWSRCEDDVVMRQILERMMGNDLFDHIGHYKDKLFCGVYFDEEEGCNMPSCNGPCTKCCETIRQIGYVVTLAKLLPHATSPQEQP